MAGTASGGARTLRRVVIAVVVLLVLLLAADRVGDYAAERSAGDTIESSQHLNSRPDVDISGFPFLTQLAAGQFGKITATASDVLVGSGAVSLQISRVQVVLMDVTVARDFSSVRAGTATATALINYDDLGKTLGVDIGYDGSGRIKATKSVTVLGNTVSATISAEPRLVNGALSFGGTAINGLDGLSGQVTSALHKIFDLSIPLQGIPFQIRLQSLSVDANGVHVVLAGKDLSYSH